jgi:caffeoyl-CoA O-methyltransferase
MADNDSRAGKRYADPALTQWLDSLHAPHDEGLQRAFDAPARFGIPAIQVGVSEGKLLEMMLRLAGAKKVVEIGALAGYSALRIARALPSDGHLWTFEFESKHASIVRDNVAIAGFAERVTVVEGAALEKLPSIEAHGPFDAVFVDADKGNYDGYGRWAAKNLRKGGMLLGDNAYYFGKLLNEDDPAAAAMRRFHEEAKQHFDTVCMPTPDGLLLGIKR